MLDSFSLARISFPGDTAKHTQHIQNAASTLKITEG